MNIKLMEYIVKISENNSITKAAQQLFITQSALDQQLIKLEKDLGIQLFNRTKNVFSLTEAGEVYVTYAKRMIELKNEAYTMIGDIAEKKAGTLSIGLTPERGIGMFMDVYPSFYRTYPDITVVPCEISVKRQLEMVQDGSLDFAFVTVPKSSLPLAGLDYISILQEELVLIIPSTHPLAPLASPQGEPLAKIDLEQFCDDSFVLMFKESTQRALIDPLFERAGFKPKLIFETASNHTLISMVEKALSCSILPDYYVQPNEKIASFSLDGDLTWELIACYKRNKYLSKAARSFIDLTTVYWRNKQAQRLKRLKEKG